MSVLIALGLVAYIIFYGHKYRSLGRSVVIYQKHICNAQALALHKQILYNVLIPKYLYVQHMAETDGSGKSKEGRL